MHEQERVTVDAVSTVLPGVTGGPAPSVDADASPSGGAFPTALEQALAQTAPAPTGSSPPVAAGQVLPAQVMKTVAQPGLIALPATAGAIDVPVPGAGQAPPVVAAAPAPVAVVNALDDIAAGQGAVSAAGGVPIAAPVGNSATAMAGVIKASVAPAPRVQGGQAEQAADASALAPALVETVTAPPEGAPVAAQKPARRLAPAEPTVVALPLVELAPRATVTETAAAGQSADAGTSATLAGNGRESTSAAQTAERPAVPVSMPTVSGGSEAAPVVQTTGSPDLSVLSAAVPGNELAAAALVSSAHRAAAPASAPPLELPLAAMPGSPEFSHELGERLLWLVREGVHEARLQLNPRELGPIEVRLGVSDGAAQVSFSAQHAGTAVAVQQSLPQLRELLAQQGLQLGQAEVSQQQPGAGQQTPQYERSAGGDARGPADTGLDAPFIGARVRVIGRGLVDAYA